MWDDGNSVWHFFVTLWLDLKKKINTYAKYNVSCCAKAKLLQENHDFYYLLPSYSAVFAHIVVCFLPTARLVILFQYGTEHVVYRA